MIAKWGHGLTVLLATSLVAACATGRKAPEKPEPAAVTVDEIVPENPDDWRSVASAEDLDRLSRVDSAWTAALAEARDGGFADEIEEEAELLDPSIALPRAAPPPGSYHCRVIKIGKQGKGAAFTAYKPFFCYVEAEDDLLTIVKQTGSQRPAGRLYADKDERLVFLGTLALGDEEAPLAYGENPERDMAGIVERVAPFRYRLVVPWPKLESKLDVFELVPATQ